MTGNTQKYLSYKEAWRRINDAIKGGYWFEAVTLCESIISDRLLSYVRGADASCRLDVHTSFARLITHWRERARTLPSRGEQDLGAAVDRWRKERNLIVHGFAKSTPGFPTGELEPFLARAKATAIDGASLARSVSNWHRKQLQASRTNKIAN